MLVYALGLATAQQDSPERGAHTLQLSSREHLQNLVWRPAGVMTVAYRMVYIFTPLKLLPENLEFNQPELNNIPPFGSLTGLCPPSAVRSY